MSKRSMSVIVAAMVVALGMRCSEEIVSTSNGSLKPKPVQWYSQAVEEAWYFLDWFLVFRERMPVNPHTFTSPTSLYAAVNEMWTVYYTNSQARQIFAMLSSTSVGMGVILDSVPRGLLVREVFANSPAEQAGVVKNDTILSVNDSICAGRPLAEVFAWIAGEAGEQRRLRLERLGEQRSVTVTLGTYAVPTVFVDSLDTTVAYIALSGFYNQTVIPGGSATELRNALAATAWADLTVLDLRGNGGGYVSQGLRIAGEFVPAGTDVIRAIERDLRVRVENRDTVWEGVTVDTTWKTDSAGIAGSRRCYVLIDGYTASASEMLLSCLRDWRRDDMVIVGESTYGKGRGQFLIGYNFGEDDYFLSDGGVARVTYSVLHPVLGAPYDSIGIPPDRALLPGEDALEVALAMIGESLAKRLPTNRIAARVNARMRQVRQPQAPPMLINDTPEMLRCGPWGRLAANTTNGAASPPHAR